MASKAERAPRRRRKGRSGGDLAQGAAGQQRADAAARPVATSVDRRPGSSRSPAGQFATLLPPVLLIAAGVGAYHNGFGGPFIFDDYTAIPDNPNLRELWPLWKAMSWPENSTLEGRPVVALSLAINHAFGGLAVWGFHAFNIASHILASLVLFGVARRTLLSARFRDRFGGSAPWLALAIALLWLVHPLNTETVDYTIQRTEGLMGLFFLLTLYCVIRGATSSRGRAWYIAAAIACGLGTGSKEVMVGAPLLVLFYDSVFLSSSLRGAFRARGALYIGLFASWIVLAGLVATGAHAASAGFGLSITPGEYLRTQAGVIVHYLRLSVWPTSLVIDYHDWPIATTAAAIVPAGAVVVGLLAATTWALPRQPALSFLGAWFFLILAPTSSILPLIGEIAAERRMYLPLVAVVALMVIAVHIALSRLFRGAGLSTGALRAVQVGLLLIVAVPLAYLTVRRHEDYRTELAIWTDAVAKRPNNARAHNSLGLALTQQGRLDEAVVHYAEAIRLKPDHLNAHNNLAIVLNRKGLHARAVEHYLKMLELGPASPETHYSIGVTLVKLGRNDDAIEHFARAVRLRPDDFKARHNLGALLYERGQVKEAVAQFAEVVRLRPGSADALDVLRAAQATLDQRQGQAPAAPGASGAGGAGGK